MSDSGRDRHSNEEQLGEPDNAAAFSARECELHKIDDSFTSFLRQRFLFWIIRWTVGLALTWAAVTVWPDLWWIWWVAGITAFLSLSSMLIVHFVIRRKIAHTARRIAEAKSAISATDNATPSRTH